ncbi:uncharacterized protein LOC118203001 [Stegodyphus dumicola]|uniref:uncharacterized protein LOC118203001 n=1 Tax=Stegodyphus dumicola TaxID=202533 RepID=UPI0015AF80CE|nr:uncharacterized protein LOC118203001 [Stegodyphus dumicola]
MDYIIPILKKSLDAELNLPTSGKEVLSQGLFGKGISLVAEHNRYTVTIERLDQKYSTSMSLLDQQKWKLEGITKTVSMEQLFKFGHYLPHRPVINPSSSTTKVRPVFDASFKRPGYAYLNECLSVGPSLIHQTLPLLLRFHLESLGVVADIKQAFLQIGKDVLRFMWWEDAKRTKLKIYRHCRVVFGITSSPFLLNATIKYHLRLQKFQTENLQNAIDKLREGFYDDNPVTCVIDVKELEQLKSQAMQVMNEATFEQRCWAHSRLQCHQSQSVLGLKWDTETDELYCIGSQADMKFSKVVRKRMLLFVVNSTYDPIGFTSPAALLPKLPLQETWENKLDWDEELSSNLQLRY